MKTAKIPDIFVCTFDKPGKVGVTFRDEAAGGEEGEEGGSGVGAGGEARVAADVVKPAGQAAEQEVMPGDVLVSINEESVRGWPVKEVYGLLKQIGSRRPLTMAFELPLGSDDEDDGCDDDDDDDDDGDMERRLTRMDSMFMDLSLEQTEDALKSARETLGRTLAKIEAALLKEDFAAAARLKQDKAMDEAAVKEAEGAVRNAREADAARRAEEGEDAAAVEASHAAAAAAAAAARPAVEHGEDVSGGYEEVAAHAPEQSWLVHGKTGEEDMAGETTKSLMGTDMQRRPSEQYAELRQRTRNGQGGDGGGGGGGGGGGEEEGGARAYQFQIIFERGKIGMGFKFDEPVEGGGLTAAAHGSGSRFYVTKTAGQCEKLGVLVGDRVISVGRQTLVGQEQLGKESVALMISTAPRPLHIVYERPPEAGYPSPTASKESSGHGGDGGGGAVVAGEEGYDGSRDGEGYEYDKEGFDQDGYDEEGYDRDGYDRDGYNAEGGQSAVESKSAKEGFDDDDPLLDAGSADCGFSNDPTPMQVAGELKNTTVQIADSEHVETDEADNSKSVLLRCAPGGGGGGGSKFVVFVVNITMHTGSVQPGAVRGATTWQVRRRYRDFYLLRRRLGKAVERIKFLFPGKKYLGKACSEEELQQRSTRLAGWLQGALKLAREQVRVGFVFVRAMARVAVAGDRSTEPSICQCSLLPSLLPSLPCSHQFSMLLLPLDPSRPPRSSTRRSAAGSTSS